MLRMTCHDSNAKTTFIDPLENKKGSWTNFHLPHREKVEIERNFLLSRMPFLEVINLIYDESDLRVICVRKKIQRWAGDQEPVIFSGYSTLCFVIYTGW